MSEDKNRRRNLVAEVIVRGRVETTRAKAKAVVGMIDRVINFAKKNTVSARREAVKVLGTDRIVDKLFSEVAPKFKNRSSGYSRIIRLGKRFSDTTDMVILELVELAEAATTAPEVKGVTEKTKAKKKKT